MKLQKFSEKKLNNRHILISFGVVAILLAAFGVYKAFAVYKVEKHYDVLKSKVGEFQKDDMQLAWTLGGTVQTGAFPTKNDGYIFDSLTCQDGVTATWDSTNWGLININPNGQNKIKCTINFNEYPWKCKRATTLHNDGTRTYGSLGTTGTLTPGDAFDCKVTTSGDYTERFYYVADQNANTAVLIYYNNVSGGVASNSTAYAYDAGGNAHTNGPVTAAAQLPTTTQWNNVSLTSTIRDIKDQTGTVKKAGFNYGNKAARLLTAQEVASACNITVGTSKAKELDTCIYLLENTKYQYGYWLESVHSSSSRAAWRNSSDGRYVIYGNVDNGSSYGVRPAIEVAKSYIQY